MTTTALVVLSGGQDSTTCLFWAKLNFDEVYALTFDYGQKHRIEIDSALAVARLAQVKAHRVVKVGPLSGRSPLTNPNEALEKYGSYEEMDKVIGNRVELTFVPGRNTLFLAYALNYAVGNDIWDVVTGVCEADNANYPDCRENYIKALTKAFNESLGTTANENIGVGDKFKIHTPLMHLAKKDTVRLARVFPGCMHALAYSHTSYDGTYPPTDNNHSNVLRAQGFYEAGYPDPLVARAWHEELMALPETSNYDKLREHGRFVMIEEVLDFISQ